MNLSSPYLRTFLVGAVWFAAVAIKMVSRHEGHWSTFPPRDLVVVVLAWIITALLLGVVVTKFEKLRSWPRIALGTIAGSFVTFALMFLTLGFSKPTIPKFKDTDEMMVYIANDAVKWVKHDRGIGLDYSFDSIKIIEEELARIAKEVNSANPQEGTFGTATGYGAYIGEVFRRRDGGTWAEDHPDAGPRSFPLKTKNDYTIFPVTWCWKRLTEGEDDNVYQKAKIFSAGMNALPASKATNP